MQREDLKTYGAVEMVLGLLEVSLGSLLQKVPTYFKKEAFVIFIPGVWFILIGFGLVCGGRKPSYGCVRFNVTVHLPALLFSVVSFGTFVRHVPYRRPQHCSYPCEHIDHHTMLLVEGLLAILLAVFVVETLLSVAVLLAGLCSMCNDFPQQPEDPERIGSTTSEPLCLQNQETPREDMKTDS